jgi:hypothetical protein
MTLDPETGIVTLPEVVTGPLVEKFGEFLLCNHVADFEIGSASNSNSTSPWIKSCEQAPEQSCEMVLLHEHFPYGLCNSSSAHAEALTARWAVKEIVSEYSRTPTSHLATIQILPTSSTMVQTQSSPSPSSTELMNHCETLPLAWLSHLLPPVDSSNGPTASPQT